MSYRKGQPIMSIILAAIVLTSISAGLVFEFPTEKIVNDSSSVIQTASATQGNGNGGNGNGGNGNGGNGNGGNGEPSDEQPSDEQPSDEQPPEHENNHQKMNNHWMKFHQMKDQHQAQRLHHLMRLNQLHQ